MHPNGTVTGIVPIKALRRAKGRLGPGLDEGSRRELAAWMFTHVLEACLSCESLGDILVVAGDTEAAELAANLPVKVVVERSPSLAAAMARGDRETAKAEATLVVAADLPLLTASDLDTVCRAGADGPCVVVAPTRDGGTGALLRRPPDVIGTAYGPGSAEAHMALAADAGVAFVRCELPNAALDVDTAGSLRAAKAREPRLARWLNQADQP